MRYLKQYNKFFESNKYDNILLYRGDTENLNTSYDRPICFTNNMEVAKKSSYIEEEDICGIITTAFLTMKNPLIINDFTDKNEVEKVTDCYVKDDYLSEMYGEYYKEMILQTAKVGGYDSVIIKKSTEPIVDGDVVLCDSYYVFSTKQIKIVKQENCIL